MQPAVSTISLATLNIVMRMSVTILVELSIAREAAPRYLDRLLAAFAQTRQFTGFEEIIAYQDEETPGKIFVLERWKSRDHYGRYIEWRYSQGMSEHLETISVAPMVVRFLTPLS